jgi:hypothetical protein
MGTTITFYTDPETESRLNDLMQQEAAERMADVSRSNFITSLINRRWKELFNGHQPAQAPVNEEGKS